VASPPPRRATVYWDPKPTWKPDHPSLKKAQLRVDPAHLEKLAEDFPDVDIRAEIVSMKNHALDNPGWARLKRNWRSTLGKWIRREDEKRRDARFKAKQARASPVEPKGYEPIRAHLDKLKRQRKKELGDGKT